MSSEFARKHGLETIWTLRMNDIHDAWTPQFRPKWKSDDPKRIMSTLEKSRHFNDRRRLWSLVGFGFDDAQSDGLIAAADFHSQGVIDAAFAAASGLAVDDFDSAGRFFPPNVLLGPTARMDSRVDEFGTSVGLAQWRIVKTGHGTYL